MSQRSRYRSFNVVLPALVVLASGSSAHAHRPTFSDGSAVDADSALEIDDTTVSQVVYHEVTDESPRLWQTFTAEQGGELWVQIGVPVIDRLEGYRPAVAVLGPGLPEVDLPFDIPNGLGGVIISTEGVDDPEVFHEHFTNTRSWILAEQTVQLADAGRYDLVAYVPSGEPGKLWVSVGTREVFGVGDVFLAREWTVKAREFHEVPVGLGLPLVSCASAAMGLCVALGLMGHLIVRPARGRREESRPGRASKSAQ